MPSEISLDPALKALYEQNYPKKIGRYSVSYLWGMLNGYLPPERYTEQEEFDLSSQLDMWMGREKHRSIEFLLKQIYPEGVEESKVEKEVIPGVVVVAKPDFILPDCVLEIKTSLEVMSKAKSWHEYQLRWYLTLAEKPLGHIVQPILSKQYNTRGKLKPTSLKLRVIGSVARNDEWVADEAKKLVEYHYQLTNLNKCLTT